MSKTLYLSFLFCYFIIISHKNKKKRRKEERERRREEKKRKERRKNTPISNTIAHSNHTEIEIHN